MEPLLPAKLTWQNIQRIRTAEPLVHNITNNVGMNATATALLAIEGSPVMAYAMALMGIAGEIAAVHADGPGSFQVHFLDVLSNLRESDIAARLKWQSL